MGKAPPCLRPQTRPRLSGLRGRGSSGVVAPAAEWHLPGGVATVPCHSGTARPACLPADPPVGGQGILFSTTDILKTPLDLVRLWLHEAERVYGDKMVDEKDQDTLRRVTITSTKKFFDVSQAAVPLRSPDAPVGRLPGPVMPTPSWAALGGQGGPCWVPQDNSHVGVHRSEKLNDPLHPLGRRKACLGPAPLLGDPGGPEGPGGPVCSSCDGDRPSPQGLLPSCPQAPGNTGVGPWRPGLASWGTGC